MNTTVDKTISRARDHYVDQFLSLVSHQMSQHKDGAAEVKLKLADDSAVFEQLYCADFLHGNPPQIVEFQVENNENIEQVTVAIGRCSISVEQVCWDSVIVHHDLEGFADSRLSVWFNYWFDTMDERQESSNCASNIIHSVSIEHRSISVDFGTAASKALWELLDLLKAAGASDIRISSSRT
ncbi:hypothetical protein [Parasphingorhabdus sp.]|uniref:hypothetical protein n=1 Tax=Parasphingorhabdus sp. TaxID=2709688 RepID=UPI003D2E335A